MSEVRTVINPDELLQKLGVIKQCLDEVADATNALSSCLQQANEKVNAQDKVITRLNAIFDETRKAMTVVQEANETLHATVSQYMDELAQNEAETAAMLGEV